ncbi:hypothetical protein QFZ76_006701 [Streptomyces sp. V4I2]|nr:hypothetical protein [Streptomyces sp. V4I2]
MTADVPRSVGGPVRTDRPLWSATAVTGGTGNHQAPVHVEDDDFVQAGNLYRLMAEDEKERLIADLAGFIAKVSREDVVERTSTGSLVVSGRAGLPRTGGPARSRAQAGACCRTGAQQRMMSRTETMPTGSSRSSTMRWRKPP